jgi:hypothetical protein
MDVINMNAAKIHEQRHTAKCGGRNEFSVVWKKNFRNRPGATDNQLEQDGPSGRRDMQGTGTGGL